MTSKLSRANLSGSDLRGAKLGRANLSGANLGGADLARADLRKANLRNSDFRTATLLDSRLDEADVTGVKLWETQRGGWSIKGIICRAAFWDRKGKELTEYNGHEFERVFAENPRIVLRYPGGMSPTDLAMLPLIIERLQAEHPDCALHIRSMEDDGSGATVTVTVGDVADRSPTLFTTEVEVLRTEITTLQQQLQRTDSVKLALEAEYRGYQAAADTLLNKLLTQSALPRQTIQIGQLTAPVIVEGTSMTGDTYNISGPAFAVGPGAHAHNNTFQQSQGGIDLPTLAEELERLRVAMKQDLEAPPEQDEAIGAVAAAEKAAKQGDGPAAIRYLKSAGIWALRIAEKIGVAVATEVLKKAI